MQLTIDLLNFDVCHNELMRFFEINELWSWCEERGIAVEDSARPSPDARLTHQARVFYADGNRSGREPAVAAACMQALGEWDECLLWVTLVGVWPSTEDWPRYYLARAQNDERRSLDVAPGHWFQRIERDALLGFLTQTMENGWDAYVLPASNGAAANRRLRVSHDEWAELQSSAALEVGALEQPDDG